MIQRLADLSNGIALYAAAIVAVHYLPDLYLLLIKPQRTMKCDVSSPLVVHDAKDLMAKASMSLEAFEKSGLEYKFRVAPGGRQHWDCIAEALPHLTNGRLRLASRTECPYTVYVLQKGENHPVLDNAVPEL